MTTQRSPMSPLQGATVLDAMHPGVVWSPPGAGVARLAATMLAHGIHALVLGAGDHASPLIVTDLELVRAALERPGARASEIARDPIASLPADTPLERVVEIMAERYVAHVLAIDPGSGAPAGIVSSFDVAAVLGGHDPRYARMIRPAPARPQVSAVTLAEARAGEVMHPGVITCTADAPLAAVARAMAEHRVHCIAVVGVDQRQHLTWRLVSDLDIVVALARGSHAEPAAAIATTEPIAVEEREPLDRVAALMVERHASHLVVVERTGLPAGVISTLDVAEILAASEP